MPRPIAAYVLLSLFSLVLVASHAHASDTRLNAAARPGLALVVVGSAGRDARLQTSDLVRSLEASLGVKVSAHGKARHAKLGQLSVMLGHQHATLLWTLPDGRNGIAHLRCSQSCAELPRRIVATAEHMYRQLGGAQETVALALRAR
ncbi:MAG: hypothetical protein QM778_30505 [Myxococcales bacterium]